MKEARTFFNLPETVKQKYSCRPQYIDEFGGWVRIEQEKYVEFPEKLRWCLIEQVCQGCQV